MILFRLGEINRDELDFRRQELAEQLARSGPDFSSTQNKALEAGTVEAFQAVLGSANNPQLVVARKQLAELEENNEILDRMERNRQDLAGAPLDIPGN